MTNTQKFASCVVAIKNANAFTSLLNAAKNKAAPMMKSMLPGVKDFAGGVGTGLVDAKNILKTLVTKGTQGVRKSMPTHNFSSSAKDLGQRVGLGGAAVGAGLAAEQAVSRPLMAAHSKGKAQGAAEGETAINQLLAQLAQQQQQLPPQSDRGYFGRLLDSLTNKGYN